MSFFPAPLSPIYEGYIFNSADFIGNNDSQAQTSSSTGSSTELSHNYLPITGGITTGPISTTSLSIYGSNGVVQFTDLTEQSTAFTSTMATSVNTMITDMTEIDTRLTLVETNTAKISVSTLNNTIIEGELDVSVMYVDSSIKYNDSRTTTVTNTALLDKNFSIDNQGVSTSISLTARNNVGVANNFIFNSNGLTCPNDISLNGYPSLKATLDELSSNSTPTSTTTTNTIIYEDDFIDGFTSNPMVWTSAGSGNVSQIACEPFNTGIIRII